MRPKSSTADDDRADSSGLSSPRGGSKPEGTDTDGVRVACTAGDDDDSGAVAAVDAVGAFDTAAAVTGGAAAGGAGIAAAAGVAAVALAVDYALDVKLDLID